MNDYLFNKVKGCLVVAGMGDGLGAPSEAWSYHDIVKKFGGPLVKFEDPTSNFYVKDNRIGEVTDDTSQMYELALALIKKGKDFTANDAADALVNWSEKYPKYYPRNAGPTTRYVIDALKEGQDPVEVGKKGGTYDRGTSNGAAMRIAPAGLLYPDNMEKTIDLAIKMTQPTHGTQHAYAGACAIACGISKALGKDTSVLDIIKACLYGAEQGEIIGVKEARIAPGSSTLSKLKQGICIAVDNLNTNLFDMTKELEKNIGNDGSVQSSVACAVAIFLHSTGDYLKTIQGGANLGGDTDTIACIAGKLAGAYSGFDKVDSELYKTFTAANPSFDFDYVAEKITELADKNCDK